MAKAGHRVLLLDMDPQQSLTQGLLGARVALSLTAGETLASLFDDRLEPDPARIIRPTAFHDLCIAPASPALNRYDDPNPASWGRSAFALREFLDEARNSFDIILADCRPTLNLLSFSTLVAADGIVVPLVPEDYSAMGLAHVMRLVRLAQERHNPGLRLYGYLLTMVRSRLGIHSAYERTLRQNYGDDLFDASIPSRADYAAAVTHQKPITGYKPRSPAARAIERVAAELLRRAEKRSAGAGIPSTRQEEDA